MKNFKVSGFNINNIWVVVNIKTTKELVQKRAFENGIKIITNIE